MKRVTPSVRDQYRYRFRALAICVTTFAIKRRWYLYSRHVQCRPIRNELVKTNKQATVLLSVNNKSYSILLRLDTNNNKESNDKQFEKKAKLIFQGTRYVTDACFKTEQNLPESIFTKSKLTCKRTPFLFTFLLNH